MLVGMWRGGLEAGFLLCSLGESCNDTLCVRGLERLPPRDQDCRLYCSLHPSACISSYLGFAGQKT